MNFRVSSILAVLGFVMAFPVSAFASVGAGPNNVRAYPGPGKGDVTLEWQRASLNGENYTIRYGLQSGNYVFVAPNIGYIATYTIHGLTPGNRYYFGLQPIWIGNDVKPVSGEASAVAPSAPTTVVGTTGPVGRNSLTAKTGPKAGQVTLTWNRYFADTTGYSVVYGTLPGVYQYGAIDAVKVNSDKDKSFTYTVNMLSSGKRYYFALIPSRSSYSGGIWTTSEVSKVAW